MDKNNLYDHYKDTDAICREFQKQRDRYFLYVWLMLLTLFILAAYPIESIRMLSQGLEEKAGISFEFGNNLVQSFVWLMFLWSVIRYYQKTIYIERSYRYIHELEKELEIYREGKEYLNNYPAILKLIHVMYQWVFPLVIGCGAVLKIIWEKKVNLDWQYFCFDGIACILVSVSSILFVYFLHCNKQTGVYPEQQIRK